MTYMELYPQLTRDETFDMTEEELTGVRVAFQWLDQEKYQLPEPTITHERYKQVQRMDGGYIRGYNDALDELSATVLPPPSNAELLRQALQKCYWAGSAEFIANQLDEQGVKAP